MELSDLKSASEKSGAQWCDAETHGLSGVELLVLPMSSPEMVRAIGRKSRKAGEAMRGEDGGLTDAAIDRIEDEAMAEVALVDWRGLTHEGEPLPFTPENVADLMALPPFWRAVRASINSVSFEANQAVVALAKNSQAPSSE